MAKSRVVFACSECGATASAWAGKCSQCGEWNTMIEQTALQTSSAGRNAAGRSLSTSALSDVVLQDNQRFSMGITEVDDVLGGGIVAGSVNLITGQPGVGKSTLLLQLAAHLSRTGQVLYVSGEESAHQVGLRAQRLGIDNKNVALATSGSADDVAETIQGGSYTVAIVDSIQTMATASVTSSPGGVAQITNSTHIITAAAKHANTAIILVGHVTKEGSIAGPKLLEHMVDVVLQLEGERYGSFKVLRAVKNRFGPTTEAGIFETNETGMQPVLNPSEALLKERQVTDGSVVLATIEGTRPLLVEVQALVNKTSYGYPKRAASGVDLNRLNLLIAVLERRTKLRLGESDVYVNVVGGLRITDPAADLALCLAIGSAAKGMKLNQHVVVFGEVGLSGEVRHVAHADRRIQEAKKLGFDAAVGPSLAKQSAFLHSVPDVRTALNQFLEKKN